MMTVTSCPRSCAMTALLCAASIAYFVAPAAAYSAGAILGQNFRRFPTATPAAATDWQTRRTDDNVEPLGKSSNNRGRNMDLISLIENLLKLQVLREQQQQRNKVAIDVEAVKPQAPSEQDIPRNKCAQNPRACAIRFTGVRGRR